MEKDRVDQKMTKEEKMNLIYDFYSMTFKLEHS